jgi:hypothetical protein
MRHILDSIDESLFTTTVASHTGSFPWFASFGSGSRIGRFQHGASKLRSVFVDTGHENIDFLPNFNSEILSLFNSEIVNRLLGEKKTIGGAGALIFLLVCVLMVISILLERFQAT